MSSITLSARLEKSKIALSKKHELHLLVSLEGKKLEDSKRTPLCLGVAIDLSQSMTGRKVEDAKAGLIKLVDHMTPDDTLAIVGFSRDVWVILEAARMTAEAKDRARTEIQALHTLSYTNLSGATLETYDQIKKAAEMKLKESVSRALLFTDGCPTTGDMSKEGLEAIAKNHPKDTSLICFGYGDDYNAELMTAMAKLAGGEAYHIKRPDDFGPTLGRVLGGLLSCVAQGVKITLKTKPDVKIVECLNDFDVKGNTEQTEAVVTVDDVYAQEKRNVLFKLALPEMDKSGRPFKLGAVSIEYQDLLAKEPRTAEVSLEVEYVKEPDADKEADKLVAEQVAILAASKAQEEAMKLAAMGQFSQANGVLRTASLQLQDVGTAFAMHAAQDLDDNVCSLMSPSAYAKGGEHYLRANSSSYKSGRGQTLGASKLYGTEATAAMEAKFGKPNVQAPAVPQQGAAGSFPQGAPGSFPLGNAGSALPNGWNQQAPLPGQGKWKADPHAPAPSVPPVKPKPTLSKKRTRR
jgi:uncharacterized protein YegL